MPATKQSFLPLPPRELLKQGRLANVPTIIGTTNFDGISMVKCKFYEYLLCLFYKLCALSQFTTRITVIINIVKL